MWFLERRFAAALSLTVFRGLLLASDIRATHSHVSQRQVISLSLALYGYVHITKSIQD